MTQIKPFNSFDLRKSDISNILEQTLKDIENGQVSALNIMSNIKKMEYIFKAITDTSEKTNKKNLEFSKKFKELLEFETQHHGKSFEHDGFEITEKESGVKYHYDKCNDKCLNELEEAKKTIEKQIKDRQEFLKSLPSEGLETINNDSGEVVTLYPPYKTSTTTLNFTLK